MPSQRKRIGFLPRSEVQNIIDEICKQNKLSQSKVTGILVDEALNSRGVLNSSIRKLSFDYERNNNNNLLIYKDSYKRKIKNDEIKMINEFIEFKFFKKIMTKNKNDI